jgi:hypothetical protein
MGRNTTHGNQRVTLWALASLSYHLTKLYMGFCPPQLSGVDLEGSTPAHARDSHGTL